MGQLGLHLQLTDEELLALEAQHNDEAIISHITNVLEERKFGTEEAAETDKSWAYIHSALIGIDPDGPLERAAAPEPSQRSSLLSRVFGGQKKEAAEPWVDLGPAIYAIMGAEVLVSSDLAYVGLSRKDIVPQISASLDGLSIDQIKQLVAKAHIRHAAIGDPQEAAEYAASWFGGLVEFYRSAAEREQNVIFSVSF